ncbi:hypothetical protein ACFVW8_15715 [Streptomyces sp. NPDC058221]|uniref:hypothetical protein n=1 Tax=Streptomyces sp. NPDC058221 TaxID=3346388 RepID=UPI0036EE9EEE
MQMAVSDKSCEDSLATATCLAWQVQTDAMLNEVKRSALSKTLSTGGRKDLTDAVRYLGN